LLNFKTRSLEPEILDDFELQGNNLAENLRELEWVNKYLGGYSYTLNALKEIARIHPSKTLQVVDLGCGGGDTLRYLQPRLLKNNVSAKLTGIDANGNAISYARQHPQHTSAIAYQQARISTQLLHRLKADVVLFNLFLHHFNDAEIISFLKTCKAAGVTVLINDLERSQIAYVLFAIISKLLRFSAISRHDGLLSVKKSFVRLDWQRLFKEAGYQNYTLKWRWAFRWLCVLKP
jgi:2-polyprenyl-3-methyl-5-hydroxy-6-metoxy-1,4-benzoquinol methylase